jgi:hypothetical protein
MRLWCWYRYLCSTGTGTVRYKTIDKQEKNTWDEEAVAGAENSRTWNTA